LFHPYPFFANRIHPTEINYTTDTSASYLNLHLEINSEGWRTILYDKRDSRACGSYQDFLDRGLLPTRRRLNQGFILVKLKSSPRRFYGRHHDLFDYYGISVTNDHGYVPLVVNTFRFFLHSRLITGYVSRLTRRVSLVEQEVRTLPEIVVCPFVLFLLTIVLSVVIRFTDSDYSCGIFKFFFLTNSFRKIINNN
jgi:hypothetical protein